MRGGGGCGLGGGGCGHGAGGGGCVWWVSARGGGEGSGRCPEEGWSMRLVPRWWSWTR